jgi:hypothetical protein
MHYPDAVSSHDIPFQSTSIKLEPLGGSF